jgi:hypothetical protein
MPSIAPSRSSRLRKYEVVYEECFKKAKSEKIQNIKPVKPSRSRRTKSTNDDPKQLTTASKKTLNSYQIFVREESKKSKYIGIPVQERMSTVAKEWKKSKDREKNKK